MSYDDDVHPYTDLVIGRVDAVLLDNVLAERAMRRNAGLTLRRRRSAPGYYVIIWRPRTPAARSHRRDPESGDARRPARSDLPAWQMWNDDQPALYARAAAMSAADPGLPGRARSVSTMGRHAALSAGAVRAAVITLVLSCWRWLAVVVGMAIAIGRCTAIRCVLLLTSTSRSCAARRCCCSCS